jgi:hypothetical protein
MNLADEFKRVRDIPYRIPLSKDEKDCSCSGKTEELMSIFRRTGVNARQRICLFRWKDLGLPAEVMAAAHDDDASHTYFEAQFDGQWIVIDATWDIGLKSIFPINDWDGKSATDIAVPTSEILSPQDGAAYLDEVSSPEAMAKDILMNGSFYKALNDYFEQVRKDHGAC